MPKKTRSPRTRNDTRAHSRAQQPASTRARRSAPAEEAAAGSPESIYAVVRAIPRGKVATYGQVAELSGLARGHRLAARAMRTCPSGLPWHRVVGKKDARRAQINLQDPEHAALQRKKLEAEGVRFNDAGFIILRTHGWLPD